MANSTTTQIDSALNPPSAQSRRGERLLTAHEYMQRTAATCATRPRSPLSCAGVVHVGMFFDGTGSNEGDAVLRTETTRRNQASIEAARQRRADRARWDAEAREFARTRS